jgi:hypothetical protein
MGLEGAGLPDGLEGAGLDAPPLAAAGEEGAGEPPTLTVVPGAETATEPAPGQLPARAAVGMLQPSNLQQQQQQQQQHVREV